MPRRTSSTGISARRRPRAPRSVGRRTSCTTHRACDGEGHLKSAPFDYHAPTSVDDAVGLLADLGDEAKPLAGGQSLVPMLAMRLVRFEHLIDLNRVADLQGVRRDDR